MVSVAHLSAGPSVAQLATSLRDCTANWLVISPTEIPRQLEAMLSSLVGDPETVGVVVEAAATPLQSAVRASLPPPMGLMVRPVSPGDTVAIRVEAARDAGTAGLDRDDPAWNLVLRLAVRGGKVIVAPNTTASPAQAESGAFLPALVPKRPSRGLQWRADLIRRIGARIGIANASADADALMAGLLQIHDFLDESHAQSQSVEHEGRHRCGDYWHAIMHRREPDYGNAKYWFHQVGRHPVFEELAAVARPILEECPDAVGDGWTSRLITSRGWDPFAFVDLCAACAGDENAPLAIAARQVQWTEMLLLVRQTWRDTVDAA